MPYIDQDARERMELFLRPATVGELNYVITTECLTFLKGTKKSYADYNAIIGVLECAKLEMYRRAVAVYEDKKIVTNGDVY